VGRQGLEYILSHDDVWAATTEEIAAWYSERYYAAARAQIRRRATTVPAPEWRRDGEASSAGARRRSAGREPCL
jgi:hypothetical protein